MGALVLALAGLVSVSPAHAVAAGPTGLSPDTTTVDQLPVLSWDRMPTATSYTVEVYKSSDLISSNLLGTATTVNIHWVPSFQVPQGTATWWRVKAQTPAGVTDWSVASFTRSAQAAPTPSSPADGVTLTQPDDAVRFVWHPVEGATGYSVDVSQDPNFVDPTRTTTYTTSATSVTPNLLQAAGTYYWRVKANLAAGISTETSPAQSYSVATPNLLDPTKPYAEPQSPADDSTTTIQDVVLDWNPVPGAAKYNLQISTDPNFQDLTTTTVSNILSTRWSPAQTLNNDQYYWRVAPVNASGSATDWSVVPVWKFRRNWPDQPHLQYPLDGSTVGDPMYFQWSGAPRASRYTVQLSLDPTFQSVYASCSTEQTTLTPSGCWPQFGVVTYWRVLATDDPGGFGSEFLNAEVHSFTYAPPLVTQESPAPAASVTVPTLTWDSYQGAKSYKVTVTNVTTGTTAVSATTTSTSYTPTTALSPDTYRWQVQVITNDNRTGNGLLDSSQPTFTVVAPPTPTASSPEITSTSLSTRRNPTLTWTPVVNATSYKIVYRRSGDTAFATPTTSYAYPAGEITSPLTPGTYEWYVVAYQGSAQLQSSAVHAFLTILPLDDATNYRAALIGTAAQAQSSGTSCGATLPSECQDLRQTPVLAWDPVTDASYYQLTVSRDDQLTNIVLQTQVNNTQWMDTASLADSTAGSAYYWEVEACSPNGCRPLSDAQHAFNKLSNGVSPLSPAQNATDPNDVTFTWQDFLATEASAPLGGTVLTTPARTEAEQYRIQIATDQQFTKVVDSAVVDQTTYTPFITTLPEGPLYWRVQAIDASGNDLTWSPPISFTKSSPVPTQVGPTAADGTVDGSVTFRWGAEPFAATYNLEVYKNDDTVPSLANRVINATGLKNVSYTPTTPLPASTQNYRWRIQRVDAANRVGAWSSLIPFKVGGNPPALVSPGDNTTVEPRGAVFTWSPPVGGPVTKYRFTATSGATTVSADTVARAYAPTAKLADGTWTWTVSTLDTAGKVVATSLPRTFTVAGKPATTVTITGSGKIGTALSANPFTWSLAGVTTTYQWFSGTSAISGATSSLYTVRSADFNRSLTLRVTGTKPGYDPGTYPSNAITAKTGDSPANLVRPTISGTRTVGSTLTAGPGSWSGGSTPTYTYRWMRSGAPITGATAKTYTVSKADAAKGITVEVTAHETNLAPGVATSAVATISRMSTSTALALVSSRIHHTAYPKVVVTVRDAYGVYPTGTVRVYNGSRIVKTVTLRAINKGRLALTLPRTTVGRHTLKATYGGAATLLSSRSTGHVLTVIR